MSLLLMVFLQMFFFEKKRTEAPTYFTSYNADVWECLQIFLANFNTRIINLWNSEIQ